MKHQFYCTKCHDLVISDAKYRVFGEELENNTNFYTVNLCHKHHEELLEFLGVETKRK